MEKNVFVPQINIYLIIGSRNNWRKKKQNKTNE